MKKIIPTSRIRTVQAGVLIVGMIIGFILIFNHNKPVLPSGITQQVTSTILVPAGAGYAVDRNSAKYEKENKLLSFKIRRNDQPIATITEQPTPDTFIDIPTFSQKFFDQAGEYKAFESVIGTVHLLHPSKGIKDAAAMNAKGTLMFVNPKISLSEDEWRKLFLSITVAP